MGVCRIKFYFPLHPIPTDTDTDTDTQTQTHTHTPTYLQCHTVFTWLTDPGFKVIKVVSHLFKAVFLKGAFDSPTSCSLSVVSTHRQLINK